MTVLWSLKPSVASCLPRSGWPNSSFIFWPLDSLNLQITGVFCAGDNSLSPESTFLIVGSYLIKFYQRKTWLKLIISCASREIASTSFTFLLFFYIFFALVLTSDNNLLSFSYHPASLMFYTFPQMSYFIIKCHWHDFFFFFPKLTWSVIQTFHVSI